MTAKAKAAAAEANGAPVDVEYDGTVYTVPTPMKWPLEVLDMLEEGKFTRALKAVLGGEQYDAFRAAKARTVEDAMKLWEAISAASGAGSTGN
jgi:hypothetical protein